MAFSRKPKNLDFDGLWQYALKVLANRAHSVGDMRAKLARRTISPQDLSAVMAKLSEYSLLNDQQFSSTFATARLQNEGFGRYRVLRDLRARRISGSVAETAVAKTFADTDEEQLAAQFLQRKYRSKNLPEFLKEEKNLASAYRRLRTGGFSSAVSLSVLKRFSRSVEDWEEPEAPE